MMSKIVTRTLLLILVSAGPLSGARLQSERSYQNYFAEKMNGMTEVVAADGTRCDILTDEYAIEVDFADNWGEAIGQSLNYGFQFDRKAGIVLILERKEDHRHFLRINSIVEHYRLPIAVWTIKAYEGEALSQAASYDGRPLDWRTEKLSISSTGKIHNEGCRYFDIEKDIANFSGSTSDCQICGGAKR